MESKSKTRKTDTGFISVFVKAPNPKEPDLSLFLRIDDIHECPVLQLHLILLDSLADGIAGFLIGILHGLHSPLRETASCTGCVHVHIATHSSTCHVFSRLSELAARHI